MDQQRIGIKENHPDHEYGKDKNIDVRQNGEPTFLFEIFPTHPKLEFFVDDCSDNIYGHCIVFIIWDDDICIFFRGFNKLVVHWFQGILVAV